VAASHLGLVAYDERLDDVSESAFARRRRKTAAWLAGFRALDEAALTPDERIDRALVVSVLRGREILADWEMWRRQPDTYLNLTLGSVFTLFLHRLRPEPELVPAVVARLRGTPAVLAAGKRNLVPELAARIFVDRALGQARAGAHYARDLIAREVTDAGRRAEVAAAGAVAAAALDDFAIFLESLAPRARGEWAIGEGRYTALLREKELLAVDTRALRERGRQEYERLADELGRCARSSGAGDDWPAVLARLNLDHPPTPETMRETYAEWTARARAFLHERGLVSFPAGEECLVEPSPVFQRPALAVASYASPPAFASSRQGHFFVPFPPDGVSAEEIQRRLEANSYASIPTTAVHEAYPGHHWHLVTAKEHPSALRRVYRTPYFSEGWALYAEQMMREQGFFADWRHEIAQYEATLFRAARIVVDTSLHMGEMTHEDAVTFMQEKANLPPPTAKAEVTRYCAWPTQAAAYLTGCLEILAMRERYLARGRRTDTAALREFHDRLAATGALPLPLAERALGEFSRAG
jgi:uncharacterized protein (DUF885 family)